MNSERHDSSILRVAGGLIGWLLVLHLGLSAQNAWAQVDPPILKQPHAGTRPVQLDLHGGFTHFGAGPAFGARVSIPLVHKGFIPKLNNAVFLTFGGDFYWVRLAPDNYAPAVGFPVTLNWQFYFTRRWSAFGEAGVNVFLHPRLFKDDGWGWVPGQWAVVAVGGRYHLSSSLALVLRLGNPYSCFGVTFKF